MRCDITTQECTSFTFHIQKKDTSREIVEDCDLNATKNRCRLHLYHCLQKLTLICKLRALPFGSSLALPQQTCGESALQRFRKLPLINPVHEYYEQDSDRGEPSCQSQTCPWKTSNSNQTPGLNPSNSNGSSYLLFLAPMPSPFAGSAGKTLSRLG